jgi:hypothetical protein
MGDFTARQVPIFQRQKLRPKITELADPDQRRPASRTCFPKGQCPHLDPGSPGIITLHVQELIHVNLQLWDLLFLG